MPSMHYRKINARHYRHIWTVGDIHGDCQLSQSRLHQLPFCPEADSLISVGDNIDHGLESPNVLCPLSQSWFTSAKGNREAVALETSGTDDGNTWFASGGDWSFDLSDLEQQEAIDLLLKFHYLPHIIEITNDTIKYVIAYVDYPGKEYQLGKEIAENELLWPIDCVQKPLNNEL